MNDKRKKRCTNVSFHNQLQTTWLRKTQKKTKTTETEQSFYGVQLFTHTWALNGSEYRTSTISVSQSTLTHLHAHSHRNFKHTCTRRREEGRGFQGEGQHERTRPWTTEADIRQGGGGGHGLGVRGLQQDDTTARGTPETCPTVGEGWRTGTQLATRQ